MTLVLVCCVARLFEMFTEERLKLIMLISVSVCVLPHIYLG